MNTATIRRAVGGIAGPLAVLAILSVAACGEGGGRRPSRPDGPAAWVVPFEASLDGEAARVLAAAGVEEVFLDTARLEWAGAKPTLRRIAGAFDGAVPAGTPVTLVVREAGVPGSGADVVDVDAAGRDLAAGLRDLSLAAEEQGLLPLGIHLDPADGEGISSASPELLRAVRDALGPGLLLSTSIARSALSGEGPDERTSEVARAVDFVVVFLYGHPAAAADDPDAWNPERVREDLAALGGLGVDFVAGLHVVGGAWHLGSSGERIEGDVSTRADVKTLALDPALRLDIDPFGGDGRLLYAFQAQGPTRVFGWRLAPGESVRVSRTSPALVRWILDALDESGLAGYTGALFHRVAAPDERLGFEAAEIAAALGSGSTVPELEWRVVVKSRQRSSVVIEVELVNRGRQSTDLATTEGNYLELRAQNGHFVAVEPGDFTRYSLWRGDQAARPGIGWREPDGVRLSTPMVGGGERLRGARLTLGTPGGTPRISVGGSFLLTGGEVLDLPVVEGTIETSLRGPSAAGAEVADE